MIIDRLRVRGKLNLLLMLPLAAVALVTVPFVAGQIDNARSASATADSARNARQLGALVWELQRERLVTADYLADPDADDSAMLLQQQAVTDSAEALRVSLGGGASDELSSALVRLGSLAELRQNARHRGVALDSVARAYHAVVAALIDALRLVPQRTTDAEGTRQLTALDALLRANEESALRSMALVEVAVSPQVGQPLLADSSSQSQMFTERFVQQADAGQAGLVVLVDQGEAAHRVDALVQHLPSRTDPGAVKAFVGSARAAAEAQASLRRLVQDQVTSQIADAAGRRAGTARPPSMLPCHLSPCCSRWCSASPSSSAAPSRTRCSASPAPPPTSPTSPTRSWSGSPTWNRSRSSRRGWPPSTCPPATRSASWPWRSTGYRRRPRCCWNASSSPGAT